MILLTDIFETKLGTEFKFDFDFKDGAFEILILEQPDYGGRDSDNHKTHRLSTGDGGFKICWTGELKTIYEAKTVAAKWACLTEAYILRGQPFPT